MLASSLSPSPHRSLLPWQPLSILSWAGRTGHHGLCPVMGQAAGYLSLHGRVQASFEQLHRLLAAGCGDASCLFSLAHFSQQDFCVLFVFLSHGQPQKWVSQWTWGVLDECKVGLWLASVNSGPGEGRLCHDEHPTLLGTLETWKRQGIHLQGIETTTVIGKIGRVEALFPSRREKSKQILLSFLLTHSENEQWNIKNKTSHIDHHTWRISFHTKGENHWQGPKRLPLEKKKMNPLRVILCWLRDDLVWNIAKGGRPHRNRC